METVIRSAVDWLTITGRSPEERIYLVGLYDQIAKVYADLGHRAKPSRFRGYEGTTCNGLTIGKRDDSAILVAMGSVANDLFHTETPRMGNCTRLDVCVDIELEERDERLATKLSERFQGGYAVGQREYRPVLTRNFDGGETVYFGRRKSRYLLRVYDRNAKLGRGELGKVWRLEVQFNKEAAAAALKLFHVKQFDLARVAYHLVLDYVAGLGIISNVDPTIGSSKLEFGLVSRSNEKTLEWLRTCVRPAIQRLIDLGAEEEVKEALGIYHQLSLF